MTEKSKQTNKILVAFDFDHTLIDDNSDLYVRKLAPGGKLPAHIKRLYSSRGWTEYMGAIFSYLHANGTTPEQMLDCMREIPLVKGIVELMQHLTAAHYSVIIISDSNSVFIDCILATACLDGVVDRVYTNPASFSESGCLTVAYYHTQDWCELSTVNLCKGHILEEHIRLAAKQGTFFPVVAYVGDGSNDLCPSLRLRSKDYVFARKGFSLVDKIRELEAGTLKAQTVLWNSGFDILNVLQKVKL